MSTKPKTRSQLSRELVKALFGDDDEKIDALIRALQETYPTLVVRNDAATPDPASEPPVPPPAREVPDPIDPDPDSPGGDS